MDIPILDEMANHLEFLGYKIENIPSKSEGGKPVVLAKHLNKNNMLLFKMSDGFISFCTNLNCDKKLSIEMIEYINTINYSLSISRVHVFISDDQLTTIRFEAVYIGAYSKDLFSKFYDYLMDDQKLLNSLKGFDEIFINKHS